MGRAGNVMAIFVACLGLFVVVGACLFGSIAIAAEIRTDPSRTVPTGSAILEGSIVPGDFEKVKRFISDDNGALQIYLASPGGNVAEAMKIGRLLRILKVTTVVPDRYFRVDQQKEMARFHDVKDFDADYMCASACFFIFVAGIFREDDVFGAPVLGIHRPYLSATDLRGMQVDQAIAAAANTKAIVADYLKEMSVPGRYLDRMFSVAKDDIQWISSDDFKVDFNGFIPELRDWADAKCGTLTAVDKKIWSEEKDKLSAQQTTAEKVMIDAIMKKLSDQEKCQSDLRFQLAVHAFFDWKDTLPLRK